jgi:hypothetical protein
MSRSHLLRRGFNAGQRCIGRCPVVRGRRHAPVICRADLSKVCERAYSRTSFVTGVAPSRSRAARSIPPTAARSVPPVDPSQAESSCRNAPLAGCDHQHRGRWAGDDDVLDHYPRPGIRRRFVVRRLHQPTHDARGHGHQHQHNDQQADREQRSDIQPAPGVGPLTRSER